MDIIIRPVARLAGIINGDEMIKKILAVVLFISSFSFCGGLEAYTNTSRIYWDVLTSIPEMKNRYTNSPDDGIAYIMSAESNSKFCWLKDVDTSGDEHVSKFYVDYTNTVYTPETYGRSWNEICKNSKRAKRVNTDDLINTRMWKIKSFVRDWGTWNFKNINVVVFDWLAVEDLYWEIIGHTPSRIYKWRRVNNNDSTHINIEVLNITTLKISNYEIMSSPANFNNNYSGSYEFQNAVNFAILVSDEIKQLTKGN